MYLLAILLYLLFLSIHRPLMNRKKGKDMVGAMVFLSMAIYGAIYALSFATFNQRILPTHFWDLTSLYWLLVMCHFFVFFGLLKSVSVRVLNDLGKSSTHTLDYQKTLNDYLVNESFKKRIELLQANGMILESNSRFILSKKGERLAKGAYFLQGLFSIKESG